MKFNLEIQSNLSYPDSCYPGTSLNRAADFFLLYACGMGIVQWVWPTIVFCMR